MLRRFPVLLLCALKLIVVCGPLNGSERGIVKQEFLFESAPFPESHASTIENTSAGLITAWFAGTAEKNPDVGIWVSRRLENKWSTPREVTNGIQYRKPDGKVHRHACWNPVLFNPSSRPLLLFYKCGPTPLTWWGMLMTSTDHGKTWSSPRRLPEGILGPVRSKPIQLPNGDLLCGSSTEFPDWQVHFEHTSDLGQTWTRIGPVKNNTGEGVIQPSLLRHANGKLQAFFRTESGQSSMGQSWSSDNGKTWSPIEGTTLPNSSSGIEALSLKDGRHLLVYNHTHGTGPFPNYRDVLNVAVTEDGLQWKAAVTLDLGEDGEFGYPAAIQTDDGLVHVTYTWYRKRIRHVVLDPSKFELREIKDGRWPK